MANSNNNILNDIIAALQSVASTDDVQQASPVASGFENVSVDTNTTETVMYLRSQGQTVPAELVGNITYGELVSRYFDLNSDYNVTITQNGASTPVSSEEVYSAGVESIVVTEQTASLG